MDNDNLLLKELGHFLFGYSRPFANDLEYMRKSCEYDAKKRLKLILVNADAIGIGESFRNDLKSILILHGSPFGKK